jgi:cell division protein FtsW (lipid II flippase)
LLIISIGFFVLQSVLSRCSKNYDTFLFPIIYLLSGWGLLTISRLNTYFGLRQTTWILAALLTTLFLVTRKRSIMPYVEKYALVGLILGIAFLAATMLWGSFPGGDGPALWLHILGVNVQPSEFLKPSLLFIFLCNLPERKKRAENSGLSSLRCFFSCSSVQFWSGRMTRHYRDLSDNLCRLSIFL